MLNLSGLNISVTFDKFSFCRYQWAVPGISLKVTVEWDNAAFQQGKQCGRRPSVQPCLDLNYDSRAKGLVTFRGILAH